ncbi:MAG: hypothetical protein EBV64_14655, partial [Oxalobacteraceae bacterium]|nr:hypothetical protein [Oxalobacteraceae bacterium]
MAKTISNNQQPSSETKSNAVSLIALDEFQTIIQSISDTPSPANADQSVYLVHLTNQVPKPNEYQAASNFIDSCKNGAFVVAKPKANNAAIGEALAGHSDADLQ